MEWCVISVLKTNSVNPFVTLLFICHILHCGRIKIYRVCPRVIFHFRLLRTSYIFCVWRKGFASWQGEKSRARADNYKKGSCAYGLYRIIDITQKLWLNYVRESLVETLMSLVSKTEMKNKYLYFIIFRYCELNILISQSSDSWSLHIIRT